MILCRMRILFLERNYPNSPPRVCLTPILFYENCLRLGYDLKIILSLRDIKKKVKIKF